MSLQLTGVQSIYTLLSWFSACAHRPKVFDGRIGSATLFRVQSSILTSSFVLSVVILNFGSSLSCRLDLVCTLVPSSGFFTSGTVVNPTPWEWSTQTLLRKWCPSESKEYTFTSCQKGLSIKIGVIYFIIYILLLNNGRFIIEKTFTIEEYNKDDQTFWRRTSTLFTGNFPLLLRLTLFRLISF